MTADGLVFRADLLATPGGRDRLAFVGLTVTLATVGATIWRARTRKALVRECKQWRYHDC